MNADHSIVDCLLAKLEAVQLVLNGTILKLFDSLVILGVNLDSKPTFEYHIRFVVSSAARSMVLLDVQLRS